MTDAEAVVDETDRAARQADEAMTETDETIDEVVVAMTGTTDEVVVEDMTLTGETETAIATTIDEAPTEKAAEGTGAEALLDTETEALATKPREGLRRSCLMVLDDILNKALKARIKASVLRGNKTKASNAHQVHLAANADCNSQWHQMEIA